MAMPPKPPGRAKRDTLAALRARVKKLEQENARREREAAAIAEAARRDDRRTLAELSALCELSRAVTGQLDHLVWTEKLRALGEMAAGVAHDFNNLLAIIVGRAELLLRRAEEPELARGLGTIHQAALDGAQTVRRIQEFTRTRRTRPFRRVDLLDIVREVAEMTRPRWKDEAQSRGISYEVEIDAAPAPWVAGRPEELREVFTNLLTNALEAMPAGGRLVFGLGAVDDGAVVTVRDTGIGMSPETARRVFEPFFTMKGPQGSGLGLAVVWGIVTGTAAPWRCRAGPERAPRSRCGCPRRGPCRSRRPDPSPSRPRGPPACS
jgi:signal transduction histidine kinase